MRFPDFPDVTDDREPELPETDVCRSEMKAAEASVSRSHKPATTPAQGIKELYEHQ